MYSIVRREAFSDVTFLWEVAAPDIARSAQPGHFVMVRLFSDAPGERWLVWDRGRYVDFPLPAIGTTVKLAPASMMGS